MAYLAFAEPGLDLLPNPVAPRVETRPAAFSALEWSVIALARKHTPASLRTPGRLSIAMGVLFGDSSNPRLADPRLEALRRIAVLSWQNGYTVPPHEVRAFGEAGFTPAQYELMVDSICVERRRSRMH